jgi:hypothetical protein
MKTKKQYEDSYAIFLYAIVSICFIIAFNMVIYILSTVINIIRILI